MVKTLKQLVAEKSSLPKYNFRNEQLDISYRIESVYQGLLNRKIKFDATVIGTGKKTPKNIKRGKYFCACVEDHFIDVLVW